MIPIGVMRPFIKNASNSAKRTARLMWRPWGMWRMSIRTESEEYGSQRQNLWNSYWWNRARVRISETLMEHPVEKVIFGACVRREIYPSKIDWLRNRTESWSPTVFWLDPIVLPMMQMWLLKINQYLPQYDDGLDIVKSCPCCSHAFHPRRNNQSGENVISVTEMYCEII
jgi:monomeric isocitrate dehydrogenase